MENLSDKQNLFLYYLVKRLGFKQDSILAAYLENTANHVDFINHISHQNKHDKYNVIDFVLEDLDFKKSNSNFVPKKQNKGLAAFNATDLAAFTFCAASYSISKTYESKETKLMSIGTQLHDKNVLIDIFNKKGSSTDNLVHNESFIDAQNSFFFEELKNSKLIFAGHSESKRECFVNEFDSFAGQPDYVFQNNKNRNFIIEEKYRSHHKSELNSYYDSHVIQLLSYIYKLVNFEAEYGYLVYWYYAEDLTIRKCKVLKVVKSLENKTKLDDVVNQVQEFNNNLKIRFDTTKLNPSKCFRCSNKLYCGHMTGKFDSISLPYERKYSQLNYVEFPSELVKGKPQPTQMESNIKRHTIDDNEILNNLGW